MKPKTEELLYMLLWAGETAMRPTFRNLTESFESWTYRSGFQRQLATLERHQLLESQGGIAVDRVHRLTETGRLLALGGSDPVARWKRRWDRKWRIVLFDVPQQRASERTRLRRSLARRGFGYLQDSVWITPDPLTGERDALGLGPSDVESLLLLEARPCAGESDTEIVAGAWDFDVINEHYVRHATILSSLPKLPLTDEAAARRLHRWFRDERLAWREVLNLDPLLPECLHPPGYRGVNAWKRRVETMVEAGRRMKSFKRNS